MKILWAGLFMAALVVPAMGGSCNGGKCLSPSQWNTMKKKAMEQAVGQNQYQGTEQRGNQESPQPAKPNGSVTALTAGLKNTLQNSHVKAATLANVIELTGGRAIEDCFRLDNRQRFKLE